jgi:hypothetical protein
VRGHPGRLIRMSHDPDQSCRSRCLARDLGHSSLATILRYVSLVEADVAKAHEKAHVRGALDVGMTANE